MAITWGSAEGHLQVGIDCWTGTPSPSNTAVTVYLRVYVRVPDSWSFDDNQSYSVSGTGGGSGSFHNGLGSGGSKLIYSRNFSASIDYDGGPTYSWTASISGMYNGGTPSHSRSLALPARPPYIPGAPTLSSSAIGPTSDTATWSTPTANGAALNGYQMHYSTSSTFSPLDQNIVSQSWATSRVVSGLAKGTLYYKRIRARNSEGYGPWSVTRTFTTDTTAPGPPGTPGATSTGSTWVNISWPAPADTGGLAITGYVMQRAMDDEFSSGVVDSTLAGTSLQVTGLAKGTTHYVRVKATNSLGESEYSATGSFTTTITTPGPSDAPVAGSIAPTTASLSWSAPVDTGGATITGYEVQRSTNPSFAGAVTTPSTTSPASLSGLLPGTTYYVRVRAVNSAGAGSWSPPSSFLTLSGVRVGSGSTWRDAIVWVGNGSEWVVAQVKVGDGSTWK
ncbi:fibronectin type III domain-containing protein [Plantactinospora sp. WMMB782]|uniref:fibronectin type III domain-containing protein n=1 Tax=Plantactinospora sp. WMMB782 TaxID=3404121 RepID=UPI003B92BE5F